MLAPQTIRNPEEGIVRIATRAERHETICPSKNAGRLPVQKGTININARTETIPRDGQLSRAPKHLGG
eukprot:11170663-Lingulodinium_polyedra.AAC.1